MARSLSDHLRLQRHIAGSYHSLRIGIATIGASLPAALWLREQIAGGAPLRGSMSVYYYSDVSRDIFIGALCAVGVFLYLYKGFSARENVALNCAGVFAVMVALFPTADPSLVEGHPVTIHVVSAVLFFICIGYVAIFRAQDTLSLVRDSRKAATMRLRYRLVGVGMVLSPLAALATAALLQPQSLVFFLEAIGVWMFALYWLIKSNELKQTNAEHLALAGKLEQDEPSAGRLSSHIGCISQIAPADDPTEWDPRLEVQHNELVSAV